MEINTQKLSKWQNEKKSLRRELLAQRRQLPPEQWQSLSEHICGRLRRSPFFEGAETVAGYLSTQGEPDLQSLFPLPKIWALPRCLNKNLIWHPWRWGEQLMVGAHGISVPQQQEQVLTANQVDLMLIPCIAGDRRGYRLGYGGGYYDRLFADAEWRTVPKIGVLFSWALRENLPHDVWDIPLQGMVTEKELCWWGV